ncbi:MAG: Fur family transcriptional regulator [Acidimicrobiales bacterium]
MTRSISAWETETGDATTLEGALALLREHGGRITSSRRFLLEAIFEAQGHSTVEELAAKVQAKAPDVHLSTIYRNVEELEKLGVIVHSHLGHGAATYHRAAGAHTHFVCEVCGATFEAPDALFRNLSKNARVRFGFEINPHHFAVYGRCQDCQ